MAWAAQLLPDWIAMKITKELVNKEIQRRQNITGKKLE